MPDTPKPVTAAARLDRAVDIAVAAGLTLLILVGFATSYRTLRDLAASQGGYPLWLSPAVPLSLDLGIVVLSLKILRAAREGRHAPVLRLLVAALSASTVIANAAAADTPVAKLLHAIPPGMFVTCFESVVITARRHALDRMGLLPAPLPRLAAAHWLLAPRHSWTTWRRMVLATAAAAEEPRSRAAKRTDQSTGSDLGARRPDDQSRTRRPPRLRESSSAIVPERMKVASNALAANPSLTAPELAVALAAAGHHVSVRTAQRVRARASAGATLPTPTQPQDRLAVVTQR